jgi:uncharacterized membrane protein YozB (DUF420 family)
LETVKKAKFGKTAAFMAAATVIATAIPVYAGGTTSGGTTVWTKASEIMKDVYSQIITISTIAAVVTASVALLLMNFSKNGKTVDESRAWLKRIIITWAILNGLSFIMAYITPFFQGGVWTG